MGEASFGKQGAWALGVLLLWSQVSTCRCFVPPHPLTTTLSTTQQQQQQQQQPRVAVPTCSAKGFARTPAHTLRQNLCLFESSSGYVPPATDGTTVTATQKKQLWPQIGDIVRFYDVDGGDELGQVLVGRISFIQKNLGQEGSGWSLEIAELDDVGSGYFADYPFQKRRSKKTMRDLAAVSPIAASFVRSEDAFKVPMDPSSGRPRVRAESYDFESFPGPFAGENAINKDVVQADAELYGALKSKIIRYAALAGLAGTVLTDLIKGFEDAAIYFAGALASVLYLFFLTIKTDTVASQEAKLGSNVSNLRFVTPLIVLGKFSLFGSIFH